MTIMQQIEKRKLFLNKGILNSLSNQEVITPIQLVEEMMDKLPVEVWKNPDLTWVQPCAKSGSFMLEIILRLMKSLPIENETSRYKHIINNMVSVYVNNQRNKWIVSKVVYGSDKYIDKVKILEINKIKGDIEMPKFDVVIGNPPYKRSLHMRMLEISFNNLKENGELIWIHPARWLQDTLAPYKKNSDFNKYKHLSFINFDIIPCGIATSMFKNEMTSDLVISHIRKNEKSILNEDEIYRIRKIPNSLKRLLHLPYKSINDVVEQNKREGIRVRIKFIFPNTSHGYDIIKGRYTMFSKSEICIDGKINGKDWTKSIQANQFSKQEGSPLPLSIKFKTINEAKNFIKYCNTNIFMFFNFLSKVDVNAQLKYLPFMDDYYKEWSDKELKKHFNISNEEMEFINKTMEQYK